MVGWQLGVTQQSKYIVCMPLAYNGSPFNWFGTRSLTPIKLSSLHIYGVLMIC